MCTRPQGTHGCLATSEMNGPWSSLYIVCIFMRGVATGCAYTAYITRLIHPPYFLSIDKSLLACSSGFIGRCRYYLRGLCRTPLVKTKIEAGGLFIPGNLLFKVVKFYDVAALGPPTEVLDGDYVSDCCRCVWGGSKTAVIMLKMFQTSELDPSPTGLRISSRKRCGAIAFSYQVFHQSEKNYCIHK